MSVHGNEPGLTTTYGLIHQEDITKVRVTWKDDQVEEADVIDQTFLIYRAGQVQYKTVEGLNAAGDVVYSFSPEVAPGKK